MKVAPLFHPLSRRLRPVAGACVWVASVAVFPGFLRAADDAAPAPAAKPATPPAEAAIFTPPAEGAVASVESRKKLLSEIKDSFDRDNPTLQTALLNAINPFFATPPPPPPAPAGTTPSGPATPTLPMVTQFDDEDKLKMVADKLHATGNLGGYLVTPDLKPLAVGQTINFTFPNDTTATKIVLAGISGHDYTLKLNGTTLKVEFAMDAVSAPPAPAPTPAPPANSSTPPPAPAPKPTP